jgi:hypothetical protein
MCIGSVMFFSGVEIAHLQIEPRPDLTIGVLGKADRARLGDSFEPRGDVDAVPHEIAVALLDDVADMDPDAEDNAPILRHAGVALDHRVLHLDGATHRVDHAAELGEDPVAGALDHAPAMHLDRRIDEVAAQRAQPRQNAVFVGPGQPAEANHIGGEDRRKFARFAQRSSLTLRSAMRRRAQFRLK